MATEEQQKLAWLTGRPLADIVREQSTGATALQAREHRVPGGFAIFADRRKDPNFDDAANFDRMDAAECASQAKEHLQKFLDAPNDEDSHQSLARCGAMVAAALSRCVRDQANYRKIEKGAGLLG